MEDIEKLINIIEEKQKELERINEEDIGIDDEEERIKCIAQLDIIQEILDDFDKEYKPIIDDELEKEILDIIKEYKTKKIFLAAKEDRKNIDKILEYINTIKRVDEFYGRCVDKQTKEIEEQKEEIKYLKAVVRSSISEGRIRDMIKLFKKNKARDEENKILDIKIRLLEELLLKKTRKS